MTPVPSASPRRAPRAVLVAVLVALAPGLAGPGSAPARAAAAACALPAQSAGAAAKVVGTPEKKAPKKKPVKKAPKKKAPTKRAPKKKAPTKRAPKKKALTKKAPTKKAPTKRVPATKVVKAPTKQKAPTTSSRPTAAPKTAPKTAPPGRTPPGGRPVAVRPAPVPEPRPRSTAPADCPAPSTGTGAPGAVPTVLPGSSGTAVGAAGSAPVLGAATAPPRPSTARAAGPAAQAPGRTTPWAFGIHGSPAGGEDAFGTVRLWDAGTTWSDLQPAPGRWDWTRLDAAVLDAESRRLEPVLVLGQTPAWASSDTRVPGMLHPGASMPPLDPRTWSAYVSAVATRYRGRIRGYEVWNEPNYVSDYYHGTEQQLASLTVLARTALRAADPGALLIGPGFATRTQGQLGWLYRYLDALPARTLDVVALHLYPPAGQGPEQAVAQLQTVEAALAGRGITAPVWNTEVNLGVVGGTSLATPVPAPLDGAYVARLLLLSRAAGIERTYWYTWSWLGNVGINLLQPDGAPSGALGAWRRVGAWMTHSTLDGCSAAGAVWTCTLRPDAGGTAQVVWTTGPGTTYAVPGGTAGVLGLEGSVSPVPASGRIPLTAVPVLLPDARQSLRQLADASMQ